MKRVTHAVPLLLALAAACQDQSAVPTATRPLFAAAAAATCPAHADFVVSDENSLLSAAGSAPPNDTIALSGMIEMTFADVFVETDNLTFTCATPGAGLRAAPNAISWLFVVLSKHVTVERLTLDAGNTLNGGAVAFHRVGGPVTGVPGGDPPVWGPYLFSGQPLGGGGSLPPPAHRAPRGPASGHPLAGA